MWQVAWQKDDLDGNRNFFSVSSDGRVICWTLVKNEMTRVEIIKLKTDEPVEGPDGSLVRCERRKWTDRWTEMGAVGEEVK